MDKLKKYLRSPLLTVALFALAAALLLMGTVTGVRAAPLIESQFYSAGVELYNIDVALEENGVIVSGNGQSGVLLANMLAQNEELKPGKSYTEHLSVVNKGSIGEYVRVSIYKYWVDGQGNKVTSLSPDLIDLRLLTDDGWIVDAEASTTERTVLYYTSALASGERSRPFADTLLIDSSIMSKVTETRSVSEQNGTEYTTVTMNYAYDGLSFEIKVEVDGVQDHNPEAAVLSAWGRHVKVENGILSLTGGQG